MEFEARQELLKASGIIKKGGVICYPTEAVYGLGCNPFSLDAISRILQIKGRSFKKGFILVAASWDQVEGFIEPIEPALLARALDSWPGPITWVFPAKENIPKWICGSRKSIALRISNHPTIIGLCNETGGPIVSTSANFKDKAPARDYRTSNLLFSKHVDYVMKGKVGLAAKPSTIRDAITGEIYRQ